MIELDCISNSKAGRTGPNELFGTVFGIVLSVTLGVVPTTNFPFYYYFTKNFFATLYTLLFLYITILYYIYMFLMF